MKNLIPLRKAYSILILLTFFLSMMLPWNTALAQSGPDGSSIDVSGTEEPSGTPVPISEATSAPLSKVIIPKDGKVIPDHYIVVYKSDGVYANATPKGMATITELGGEITETYQETFQGYSAYLPEEALDVVLSDPGVAYVEADAIYSIDTDVSASSTQTNAVWGLDRIDQHVLPLNQSYNYAYTGAGVNVYVFDTGINSTHTQFGGRASKDFDAIGDGQNGNDCNGHGTHVAGTIGAQTYGVAKGVNIHSIRVLGCNGSGTTSQLIAGINWVIAHHSSPAVANFSLGGPTSEALDTAIQSLINNKVAVVAAAGNASTDACSSSPARVEAAITVGATTSADARASYSNYGSCLDLFAPGSNITSTWIGSNTATKVLSGTSMAAPHVTGVIALYLQTHKSASVTTVTNTLVNAATKNLLSNIGTNSPNKLLYSFITGGGSTTPIIVSPGGVTGDSTPIFKWGSISGASQYQVQVYKGSTILIDETVKSSSCSSYICKYTMPYYLADYSYRWRVRSYSGSAWHSYTDFASFTVKSKISGFNSQFVNNATGWSVVSGGWGIYNGTYRSLGTYQKSVSVAHENNYPILDFTVAIKRTGDQYGANRITFWGTPEPLFGTNHWYQGFTFQYTNDQKFLIYKSIAGFESIVVPWTDTNYIQPYGWNKIRIVANASTSYIQFYINGHLIAYGWDTSLRNGRVGFGMYKNVDASSPIYVDYAILTTPYNNTVSESSIPDDAVEFAEMTTSATTINLDRSPK